MGIASVSFNYRTWPRGSSASRCESYIFVQSRLVWRSEIEDIWQLAILKMQVLNKANCLQMGCMKGHRSRGVGNQNATASTTKLN